MRTNSWILRVLVAAIGVLLWACPGSSDPTTDSQTNWLSECQSASDCEGGLDCVCGTCTIECADSDGCETPGPSVCAPADSAAVTGQCGATAAASICLPECVDGSDCGSAQACVDGYCVPDAGEADPDPDASDVGEDDATDVGSDSSDDVSGDVADTSDVAEDVFDGGGDADASDGGGDADASEDAMDTSDVGDVDCGELVLPDPGICTDIETLTSLLDEDGCPWTWACVEDGCSPPMPGACDLASGEVYRETAAACPDWECLPAGSFSCGDTLDCTLGEEYCDVFQPGVMGSEIQYTCQPLPEVCAVATRCECLHYAIESEFPDADCREIGETGGFSWTVSAP